MAIPATRTGEAVEIPIPKNSYSNSVILNDVYNPTKYSHLLQSQYSHVGTPTNTSHGGNGGPSRTWLKNYNHLLPSSLSSPDLNRSGSLDNLSHLYPNIIGRKSSQSKFRIKSGSEKDLFHLQTGNPYDYSSSRDNKLIESESSESYSDDENSHPESEIEDEQAMSLYKSLTLSGYNTNTKVSSRNLGSSSSNVVPTLREFPNMQSTDINLPKFPGLVTANVFPKFINSATTPTNSSQKKQISFLEDHPQSEYLRSHERANASLIRMRSRRKSKSSRQVLILTQNNYRLPSFDRTNQTNSPTLSPGSPVLNQQITSPKANFTSVSREKENSLDPAFDTQLSPINNNSQKIFDTEVSQVLADIEDTEDFEVSSFMINDVENIKEDTNKDFTQQDKLHDRLLRTILIQCLADCDIEDEKDKWISVLQNSLKKINHLKLTDTLDIRQYVKIKKIYGGEIKQTHVLEGLFFTKNIDSRKMPSSLRNPKIALLMFPIEYLKQKDQFISLRIIHSQQNVYITNLVSRLISMEPDIVVVGDTVCGLAISLLEEAGITVISNVKPQIVERISRYTKADIFQSVNDLFFKKGVLGECSTFEIRKYSYENLVKTFSFFIGTDISSGFTICLRGGNEDLLNSIKYAAETLMPGYLNAKFEESLFEDHNVSLISGPKDETVEEINRSLAELAVDDFDKEAELQLCEYSLTNTEVLSYVKLFNERVLSVSPAVEYTLPSPLINVITSYLKFHNYYKTHQMIQNLSSTDSIDKSLLDSFQINFKELPQEDDLLTYLKFASENRLASLITNYEARIRNWFNCMTYTTYQLYPIFHRLIQVLHSCVSIKHATPCTGPNTVVIDYYTDNDKCLGLFLDQIFQESSRLCQECGDSMLNHYKTYAHGNAKLDVIVEKFDILSDQHDYPSKNQRVMWSVCKICKYSTPIVPMHDESYYLSIGKFLELSFYGQNATINHPSCNHPFFKNHIRFFSLNNIVIRLEYSHIDTYEVVVPKKQLEFVSELDINLKIEVMNSIQEKSKIFFRSIYNRLNRVKVDTYAKAEEGLLKVEELKELLESQIHNIRTKTKEIYNTCAPNSYISLNIVLRDLQELGVAWDKEFTDFEEKYLPSEVEITKITQFHLRNFLLDKYNESEIDKTESTATLKESGKPDDELKETVQDSIRTKNSSLSSVGSIKTSNEFAFDLPSLNREQTKEIGSMIPSSLYDQSNFTERISMWKEFTSKDGSSVSGNSKPGIKLQNSSTSLVSQNDKDSNTSLNKLRSFTNTINNTVNISNSNDISTASSATNSKVHQLANFFDRMNIDQISLEFKKQREQELQKKTRNQFIANPIVESKPIVEIYDNIEEAVDVHAETKKSKTTGVEKKPVKRVEDVNDEKSYVNNTNKALEIPQPEKQSLLKSLTNFWADRSATLWDPLKYVLESDEHTFADSEVIVREDEPSSLVAFCLSSSDYKQKIEAMEQEQDDEMLGDSLDDDNDLDNKKLQNFIKIEKKFKQNYIDSANINPLEKIMIKRKSNHLKYQFNDGSANLSCKIFYAEQFEALRKSCGNNDNFIQSLSRCIKWDSQGGKSRSSFLKTLDNRYIVKELSPSELESFVALAPFYFRYISQSIFDNLSSAIAKIFGFYQIEIKNTLTGKTFKMDFLIMENLFYNHNTTRIFDLKGSMRNRHVQQTGKQDEVLLDENMIEYIYESPVFVKEHSKKLLRGSLFNDTSFLSAMDVMDYSLVVGIDDSSHKLYIGIIDWLRTFTWDKKVENWVKGNNLIGGNKRGKDPTVVTPKQYRTRFREAMERYILEVPDIWYEGSNQVV
jgi:1-phosphatidylinositol-3-phosphate 5-kinase